MCLVVNILYMVTNVIIDNPSCKPYFMGSLSIVKLLIYDI